jgi:hypothetical protein
MSSTLQQVRVRIRKESPSGFAVLDTREYSLLLRQTGQARKAKS